LAIRPGFHVIDQTSLAIIIGITTASAFVFWLFDFHPPKLLMGDAGSTLLGFLLAVFAVFAGGKIATAFIVMGFPIFDVLLTVTRRIIQKKSPLKGDYQHLHHDLLRAGLSERKTVLVIYALSAMFGLTALYLDSYKKLIAIVIIFTIMAILKVWLIQRASRLTSAVE
jgi:UDP-GlcNAc:undecaprenyl-phosphate GlcNAc-1-phosphate transferase